MAQRFIIKLPNFMQCVKVRRYIQGTMCPSRENLPQDVRNELGAETLTEKLTRLLTVPRSPVSPSRAPADLDWAELFKDDLDPAAPALFVWEQSPLRQTFLDFVLTQLPEAPPDDVVASARLSTSPLASPRASPRPGGPALQAQAVELKPRSGVDLNGVPPKFVALVTSLPDLSYLLV